MYVLIANSSQYANAANSHILPAANFSHILSDIGTSGEGPVNDLCE